MIKQQQLLMKTEDIDLVFTSEAIHELAAVAAEVQTGCHPKFLFLFLSGYGLERLPEIDESSYVI